MEQNYEPKAWHFDLQTKQAAHLQGKNYVLLSATPSDIDKVITFYQHHPVGGYGISNVEVIYNPTFNRGFALHLDKLQHRHHHLAFAPHWPQMAHADLRQEAHAQWIQLTQPIQTLIIRR